MNTPLKNTFEVLKGTGNRSLEEVMPLAFQFIDRDFPNFGLSKETIWLKFTVQSMAKEDMEWLLEIKAPFLATADFYIQDSLAKWQTVSVGYEQPFANRRVFYQHPNCAIRLKAFEKKTIYLCAKANGLFAIMPFAIAPTEILQKEHTQIHFVYGIYFGIAFFVLLTNLFALFVYKDKVYFFYSFYIISSIIFTSWLTGHIFWVVHQYPLMYYYSGLFFGTLTQINIAQFLIRFLKLDDYSPFRKRLFIIYSIIAPIAYFILILFAGAYEMIMLGIVLANLLTFLGMEGAWSVHKKGHPTAIYFCVAYSIFLVGVTLMSLYGMGIINNFEAKFGYDWAALCEMIVISFALSVQQGKDIDKAQKEALFQTEKNKRLIQEQNTVLEQKVAERTAELAETNEELNHTLQTVEQERRKSDSLLLNILPTEVASELKETGKTEVKYFESVTVLFADVKGFSALATKISPQALIAELDATFTKMDEISERFGLERIKTIGDCYMACGGLPHANRTHAFDVVLSALNIQHWMHEERERRQGNFWEVRLGIHTGDAVAGVIGK
ncbi:MAG: hypothetical protein EAZ95_20550, partial [Bacteroidetes bacterium]